MTRFAFNSGWTDGICLLLLCSSSKFSYALLFVRTFPAWSFHIFLPDSLDSFTFPLPTGDKVFFWPLACLPSRDPPPSIRPCLCLLCLSSPCLCLPARLIVTSGSAPIPPPLRGPLFKGLTSHPFLSCWCILKPGSPFFLSFRLPFCAEVGQRVLRILHFSVPPITVITWIALHLTSISVSQK